MPGKLQGKVAIVTLASEGQPAAQARRFVAEGAKVVIADNESEKGRAVATELGKRAVFVPHDVTHEASWLNLVAETERAFGKIDVLVNGGGANLTALMLDTTPEQFMEMMRINALGPWLGMRAMIAPMSKHRHGAIVNNSSAAVLAGLPGKSAYAATKGGLKALSLIAARELGQFGIRVNSVLAAAVATELNLSKYTMEELNQQCSKLPIPRIALADEIASAIVFLASDEAAYITGAEIVIDGGQSAAPIHSPLIQHLVQPPAG